jgi:hypothetical protein
MTILTSKSKVEINRCSSIRRRSYRDLLLLLLLRLTAGAEKVLYLIVYIFTRIGSLIFITRKPNHVSYYYTNTQKGNSDSNPSCNGTWHVFPCIRLDSTCSDRKFSSSLQFSRSIVQPFLLSMGTVDPQVNPVSQKFGINRSRHRSSHPFVGIMAIRGMGPL